MRLRTGNNGAAGDVIITLLMVEAILKIIIRAKPKPTIPGLFICLSLDIHLPLERSRVLKISSGSNPKTVAGAISHISRQGECPSMLATGASSINQAIKAVAIARGYLDENKIELTCYPDFRTDKRTGLSLILTKSIRRPSPPDKDVQQLKVSKGSNPSNVAGAIANKLRDGQRVWVLAIGADSVTHAVKAISIGRKYLEADGLDISFRPEFTRVKFDDGRDCSALKLIVLAQQI